LQLFHFFQKRSFVERLSRKKKSISLDDRPSEKFCPLYEHYLKSRKPFSNTLTISTRIIMVEKEIIGKNYPFNTPSLKEKEVKDPEISEKQVQGELIEAKEKKEDLEKPESPKDVEEPQPEAIEDGPVVKLGVTEKYHLTLYVLICFRGCFLVAFSPSGSHLCCAITEESIFPLLVYSFRSASRKKTFSGMMDSNMTHIEVIMM
jgi:hypothetical protein